MAIVSLFNVTPAEVRSTSGLDSALRAAGITHLEMQVMGDWSDDPMKWGRSWEATIGRDLSWCDENGWRVIALGDNFMRMPWQRVLLAKSDGFEVKYIAHNLGFFGIVDRIEMVDEIGADPSDYPAKQFVEWWREAGGPPIFWPTANPRLWEVPELADGASRLWMWESARIGEDRTLRLSGSLSWPAPDGWRKSCLIDASGIYGELKMNGKVKSPYGRKPPSPMNIEKQFRAARYGGATDYRIWAYHCRRWQEENARAKPGDKIRVGISPGAPEWEAMAKAIALLKPRS